MTAPHSPVTPGPEVCSALSGEQLAAAVYAELHAIATGLLRSERRQHTLQPTALVHEAYVRLMAREGASINDRAHFLSLCARTIRHVLVDHARACHAQKRGGAWYRVTLSGVPGAESLADVELLALDEALTALRALDARQASVVELKFFGGMNDLDVARMLGVSDRTVRNDWAHARVWLKRRLTQDSEA